MKKTNKKKINKKGFSKGEFMVMLAALAILFAIGTKYVLDSTKSYGSFKTLANNFANAVAKYKDKALIQKKEYSLYEVEKGGDIIELTSPFDKKIICDKYESTVILNEEDNSRIIKLICGEYVVEAVQGKLYKVYELGEWQDEYTKELNDGDVLYNYKENGNLMLEDYVPAKSFISIVSEEKGIKISSVTDIKNSGRELVSKQVYRTKELLQEFK